MANVLMTICTYDDPAVAERDAETLRENGIPANVAKCLYEDPDLPGVDLVDLVVFDDQVKRAQEILELLPPDWNEELDRNESPSVFPIILWLGVLLAALVVSLRFLGIL